jgi:hypothetical protein
MRGLAVIRRRIGMLTTISELQPSAPPLHLKGSTPFLRKANQQHLNF